MADLDDGPDQVPLAIERVQETTARLLAGGSYKLILSHCPKGEYTRHRRHAECCESVVELWRSGGIDTKRLWLFAYEDGGREYLPRVGTMPIGGTCWRTTSGSKSAGRLRIFTGWGATVGKHRPLREKKGSGALTPHTQR